ncbi:imm11 family protein [Paenibacillus sp. CAU 1782]
MKIYWLDYHPAFNRVDVEDRDDHESMIQLLKSEGSVLNEWNPIPVTYKDNNRPSDFLGTIEGCLIVSAKVKELLTDSNERFEFLPLQCQFQCYILKVLSATDCIDSENSKMKPPGYIRDIFDICEQVALLEERVKGYDIFRIKPPVGEKVINQVFVSDEIKAKIEGNSTGYQLLEIWDSHFSWKQKESQFKAMCRDVDNTLVETFDFGKAVKYVQKNKGKQAYSGEWSLKVDDKNEILLGRLLIDGTYSWINPMYYPPIILGLTWGITERNKSFFGRLMAGMQK